MNQALYAIYGASGCGRSLMPVARMQLLREGVQPARLLFIDDHAHADAHIVNGHELMSYETFVSTPCASRHVLVAIANSRVRETLAARCHDDGVLPWSVRADNAVVMDDVRLGAGAAISPFVTLACNIRIGAHFQANLYSYVEHDCVIGDFVTFAPGAKCNGNVVIHDHAYIGAGAVIRNGRPGDPLVIGQGAVIGMGAVVTRSIAPGVTVVGNPARPLSNR